MWRSPQIWRMAAAQAPLRLAFMAELIATAATGPAAKKAAASPRNTRLRRFTSRQAPSAAAASNAKTPQQSIGPAYTAARAGLARRVRPSS